MATIGQFHYRVLDVIRDGVTEPEYSSNITSEQLYGDICDGKTFIKVGVQAPPGTQIVFNQNKTVMVGRTGVYEIEETTQGIKHMRFVRPRSFVKDTKKTADALRDGIAGFRALETTKKAQTIPSASDTNGWASYVAYQTQYLKEYNRCLKLYNSGIYGVYELGPAQDLDNVIIDYVML